MSNADGLILRHYRDSDAETVGGIDKLLELTYRYHPDYQPENIICAFNADGQMVGVGHIEYHETWHAIERENEAPGHVHRLRVVISTLPDVNDPRLVKQALLRVLLKRATVIRNNYPDKCVRVFTWLVSDDNAEMDFYLSQGFLAHGTALVMKRDLSEPIPDCPAPRGVVIRPTHMATEPELLAYHEAATEAFAGENWSLNTVRWMRGGPEWLSFGAFAEAQLIGHTMTWMITEERSATDDIFVRPAWRRQGVARSVVTAALQYLAAQGKSMATLSVHGDNATAIALYQSLGFKMYYVFLEFGLDI